MPAQLLSCLPARLLVCLSCGRQCFAVRSLVAERNGLRRAGILLEMGHGAWNWAPRWAGRHERKLSSQTNDARRDAKLPTPCMGCLASERACGGSCPPRVCARTGCMGRDQRPMYRSCSLTRHIQVGEYLSWPVVILGKMVEVMRRGRAALGVAIVERVVLCTSPLALSCRQSNVPRTRRTCSSRMLQNVGRLQRRLSMAGDSRGGGAGAAPLSVSAMA